MCLLRRHFDVPGIQHLPCRLHPSGGIHLLNCGNKCETPGPLFLTEIAFDKMLCQKPILFLLLLIIEFNATFRELMLEIGRRPLVFFGRGCSDRIQQELDDGTAI